MYEIFTKRKVNMLLCHLIKSGCCLGGGVYLCPSSCNIKSSKSESEIISRDVYKMMKPNNDTMEKAMEGENKRKHNKEPKYFTPVFPT